MVAPRLLGAGRCFFMLHWFAQEIAGPGTGRPGTLSARVEAVALCTTGTLAARSGRVKAFHGPSDLAREDNHTSKIPHHGVGPIANAFAHRRPEVQVRGDIGPLWLPQVSLLSRGRAGRERSSCGSLRRTDLSGSRSSSQRKSIFTGSEYSGSGERCTENRSDRQRSPAVGR